MSGPFDRREKSLAARAAKAGGVLLGSAVGTALAAAGGWIAYSNTAINHHLPIGPAIEAERRSVPTQSGAAMNVYFDLSGVGRPLVLIHSVNAAASAYEMGPIFNRYRQSRPIYAVDLPGFGFSDRSDRDYLPMFYQEAILDLIRSLPDRPVDVVALSLGCEFAARAAAIEPDWFHSLVMISPTGFRRLTDEAPADATAVSKQRSQQRYQIFSNDLWARPLYDLIVTRPSIRYFLGLSFYGPVPREMVEYDYATAHQPGAQWAPLRFISGQLFTRGVRPAFYERIEFPVLVLYDEDAFTSFETLPEMVQAHNRWRAVRIEQTRGLPHFERMEQTAAAMNAFWTEIDQPGS